MKRIALLSLIALSFSTQDIKWTAAKTGDIYTIANEGGKSIAYSIKSGIRLITHDGYAFKDLNKNGQLDKYEDWRLNAEERAKDLASKMSVEQIAGLMLYSRHQSIPGDSEGFRKGTYRGKSLKESGAKASALSDQQMRFLVNDHLRHVLITTVQSPEIAAEWNNNAQALVEGLGLGIPVNTSTDPRHGIISNAEFNEGAGGSISMWPGSLGMAATFDPELVRNFGSVAAREYRALGISTALSPQIDLSTDPRWNRFNGTFGEDPALATDMARAYVDGFQTSSVAKELEDGWGYESVNAMVKHWPGGGSGEAGRDAHYGFGKFAVYPGNNFDTHLIPFTQGAFKLSGKTGMASAIMPYYTVSWDQDKINHENVGNSYNRYIIQDLLRDKYGYDGVACTDWLITGDETAIDLFITGKPWGVEKLTIAERHYKVLMAGVDQFGGNNEMGPVLEAYHMGIREHGEAFMRARFERSAVRLLKNIIRPGLFENPYLDVADSKTIVGNPAFMKAGYEAQLRSIVMVKNKKNILPLQKNLTVYVPKRFTPAGKTYIGIPFPEKLDYPVSISLISKYFSVTDNPEEADLALVFIEGASSGNGYDSDEAVKGGTGYVPVSLQYRTYTATTARDPSIAGGDPLEKFTNRSYKGKSSTAINTSDLDMVIDTRKKMKGKPVIVSVNLNNPSVFAEFEKLADAILVTFNVQDQATLDILTGAAEPNALLPLQIPANMETVEKQMEDVPHDMQCHKDSEGNTYDFAFGLNWKGLIQDKRTEKYQREGEK